MKFKDLVKKIGEAVEVGKPETTKAYASVTPGQPDVVFTPPAEVDGVKIAAELDPAGGIEHNIKHALDRKDKDEDGDVDAQDKHTPDEVTGDEKKNQTLHLLKKGAAERAHTKKGVAYEGYVATAPAPGDKWKDHAVMVNNTGKKQRVVILRKNIDNYPASDGWKEVRPGFKEEVELDEAMTPQQKSDFDRMMAGAMSRAAYNAKWKKPLKSDDKVIYGKNVKEDTEVMVEELTEDQTEDWKRIQAMDKGSVLDGKDGARKKLAYLNAVLAFQKKYGKDALKTKKEIERINQSHVAEGAPIVVMPSPERLKKAEPTKVRYQGDIVPPAQPPSTEKRGVKGRPGQRPMPKYDEGVAEETEVMVEKLTASDDMGKWIDDFQKSDAPQFAGKSKEERRKMAIAAKMSADRDAGVKEDVDNITESEEKTIGRLKQLVRFGLMDKSKLPLLSRAMSSLEKGNVANPTERQVLFDLLNELIGVVTGDDAMFAKVRMSVQNEGTDLEEQ